MRRGSETPPGVRLWHETAVTAAVQAERDARARLIVVVRGARQDGFTWDQIGVLVGLSGEALWARWAKLPGMGPAEYDPGRNNRAEASDGEA